MEILKFSTTNCAFCRVVHPSVLMYATEVGAIVQEVSADDDLNTSEDKALCEQYDITSVPVVVVRKSGNEEEILRGYHDIMNFINHQM